MPAIAETETPSPETLAEEVLVNGCALIWLVLQYQPHRAT